MPGQTIRNVNVRQQGLPGVEVLWGAEGDRETLDGTLFIAVAKPYQIENGGPQNGVYYRIRASDNVDDQHMRFDGYSPQSGAARFADR